MELDLAVPTARRTVQLKVTSLGPMGRRKVVVELSCRGALTCVTWEQSSYLDGASSAVYHFPNLWLQIWGSRTPFSGQDVTELCECVRFALELLVLAHDELNEFTRVDLRIATLLHVDEDLTWDVHGDLRCLLVQVDKLLH